MLQDRARLRRDVLLVGVTVVVCAAIFTPLTLGSGASSGREFTIWPNNSVRFANMDWFCEHQARVESTNLTVPQLVYCQRESTARGLKVIVTGDVLRVFRCPGGNAPCTKLFGRVRSP